MLRGHPLIQNKISPYNAESDYNVYDVVIIIITTLLLRSDCPLHN